MSFFGPHFFEEYLSSCSIFGDGTFSKKKFRLVIYRRTMTDWLFDYNFSNISWQISLLQICAKRPDFCILFLNMSICDQLPPYLKLRTTYISRSAKNALNIKTEEESVEDRGTWTSWLSPRSFMLYLCSTKHQWYNRKILCKTVIIKIVNYVAYSS